MLRDLQKNTLAALVKSCVPPRFVQNISGSSVQPLCSTEVLVLREKFVENLENFAVELMKYADELGRQDKKQCMDVFAYPNMTSSIFHLPRGERIRYHGHPGGMTVEGIILQGSMTEDKVRICDKMEDGSFSINGINQSFLKKGDTFSIANDEIHELLAEKDPVILLEINTPPYKDWCPYYEVIDNSRIREVPEPEDHCFREILINPT